MQGGRKHFVGGNWKSNNTLEKTKALIDTVINKLEVNVDKTEVVVAPVFVHIPIVQSLIKTQVQVSAQNVSKFGFGAFTGEIRYRILKYNTNIQSPDHLVDLGIKWTILGHSERRNIPELKESDEFIAEKAAFAIAKKVQVIYCIGELLEQRKENQTFDVLNKQLLALIAKVGANDWASLVLAYEPVWAIGTGVTASPAQAQEVHDYIRKWVGTNVNQDVAQAVRIIYGGSVTKENCKELIGQQDVDGFLVGGASLKEDFIAIVNATNWRVRS